LERNTSISAFRRGLNFLGIGSWLGNNSGAREVSRNLGNTSMRIPLQRIVQSVQNWRDAVNEAEYYIPFRVKMQQINNELQDEPHIAACMERRMDLTLQRDYVLDCGNDEDTKFWTDYLRNASWFVNYQRLVLTAKFRGYTLISIGNIVTDNGKGLVNALPEMKMLEHSLVSPDRRNFAPVIYSVTGEQWDDDAYRDWHIFVDTPPETGNGCCGYGLLHKCAVPGIILRTTLADWANYNEKFGQPVTWAKTAKQDDERRDFFNQLKSMGAAATFITDKEDELQFVAAPHSGEGFKPFEQLKIACEKLVSKNFLGHADVLDSIPKRSGAQSGESNPNTPSTPVQEALSDIMSKDGRYCTPYVNELISLLRRHGVGIPEQAVFRYTNDEEEEISKEREYVKIQRYADIANTMKLAGLQMAPEQFTKETGVKCDPPATNPPAP